MRQFSVLRLFGVLLAMVMCAPVFGQDVVTVDSWGYSRPSRFSYGRYNLDGESVSVSYHRVGRFTYGYHSDGTSSTTRRIGGRVYTDVVFPVRSVCPGGKCR